VAVKTLRERQAEGTRQLLLAVARGLFAEHGYAGTSIEEIIQRAGVARGALYHHFPGKDALFRAVYDAVQADLATRVVTAAVAATEPWAMARAGLSAFLDACLEPEFRRIVIIDSVAVLHKDVWADPIEHLELPTLRAVLGPLVDRGVLPGIGVEALVHVALGGLYGAALYIARSPDPKAAQAEADAVVDTIIRGLQGAASPHRRTTTRSTSSASRARGRSGTKTD
jgi:AcrR family transcriptional regulator